MSSGGKIIITAFMLGSIGFVVAFYMGRKKALDRLNEQVNSTDQKRN